MLQSIRDKSQGWFAWTIVTAVCITFALWGVHSYLYNNASQSTVAKVNGTKVTQQQLSNVYNQLKRQQRVQLGANYSSSQQSSNQLKKAALQNIISSIALNQDALHSGFRVGTDLVEAAIARMPMFQQNGEFSEARFEQILSGMLYSTDQFFAQVQDGILVNQVRSGILASSFALPNEVNQSIKLLKQKRSFGYLLLPIKTFMGKVKLPENAAQAYYKKNQDEFKTPEQVSIQYIELSVSSLMKGIHPTAAQIKQFYESNLSAYTQPKQWRLRNLFISIPESATPSEVKAIQKKVEAIEKQLKKGTPFATLVKQYSEDNSAGVSDGQLPWISDMELDPNIKAALAKATKIGDVTPVIKTGRGFLFSQYLASKPKRVLPFNEVKAKVAEAYKQQKAETKFSNMSDDLANSTYEDPTTLTTTAKKLGLTIQATGLFTKNSDAKSGILANPKIIKAAFGDDVVEGNNSDPVNISDDSVVVLRMKQHIPAAVKPLKTVKEAILTKLKTVAASKMAQVEGNKLVTLINKGQKPVKVASDNGFRWQTVEGVSRRSKRVNSAILDAAFHVAPTAKNITHAESVQLETGDSVIIALNKILPGNVASVSQSKRSILGQGTEQGLGMLDYQLYVLGIMDQAKIKYLDKTLDDVQ